MFNELNAICNSYWYFRLIISLNTKVPAIETPRSGIRTTGPDSRTNFFWPIALARINGYSDTGIARYAALCARQARYAAGYQREFDSLAVQGFRPLHVAGYGDGFYAAQSACAFCSSKIGRSEPDGNSAQTGKARSSRKKWMPS
ncbi:hypothetical protein [Sinorhizobium meliloti]|uniref:hypothetical protein n=1 Tax=Rhizobium meliloti TaxID=382 RepID=UPI003B3B955D